MKKRLCMVAIIASMGCSGEKPPVLDAFKEDTQSHLGIVRVDTNDVQIDERAWDNDWVDVRLDFVEGSASNPATWDATATWSGHGAIHVRGNSSREYEKKQYALETRDAAGEDIDVAPFGLPEEEDWILQGPYSDKTLMRNHLMFQWARSIGRYAPRTRFVELFMADDGQELNASHYRGVYVFAEKIKRDKNRVDVEKLTEADNEEPDVQGGYLIKRDWLDGNEIITDVYNDELVITYPKADNMTDAQRTYLGNYLNDFESALKKEDGSYRDYADMDSFIDQMMMMELSRNVDAYVLSTYMHKKRDGLLTMGPIWDFNGSLGNADYFESREIEGWHYENAEFPADNPNGFHWYAQMLKDDTFQTRLRERWTTHRSGPWSDASFAADIDQVATLLAEAQVRNFERWPVLGTQVWPNDYDANGRQTYEEEVAYFKSWLTERAAWLDTQWMNPE
jgi:hypothetical protein